MENGCTFTYRRLRHALRIGLVAGCGGIALLASSAHAGQRPAEGSIHGVALADVPSGGGRTSIPLAGLQVTVTNAATSEPVGETLTRPSGGFATPLEPPGTYRVCADAPGFARACSQPLAIGSDSVALNKPLRLRPAAGVLHGHVALEDGTPAARLAVADGMSAAAAQVSLADAKGRVIAGPTTVNAAGDYVLANIAPGTNLILSARYEGNSASRGVTLSQADLAAGKPFDVILPGTSPVVTSVAMSEDGNPLAAAAPGGTVTLTVNARGRAGLHYSWTGNVAGLAAADSPSVTITLPAAPVGVVLFLEITDGEGGLARGSITIPMAGASTPQPALAFQPEDIGAPSLAPSAACSKSAYCIPPHDGPFIDPTLLMAGACNSEATCKAEAINYYKAIGALLPDGTPFLTGTFKGWKAFFGFSENPTHPANGEVRAVYYNNADLGFGRDMHCLGFGPGVACYVSNYGDGTHTFGSEPQAAIRRAASNIGRIATVAMLFQPAFFLPVMSNNLVQFYVFSNSLNNDPNDGSLLTAATLDSQGAKATPGICLDCHGGQYDPTVHEATGANFLPFDAGSFIFSTSKTALLESSQRGEFRLLNSMVETVNNGLPTISQLIDGWYAWCGGIDAGACYQDDVGHPFYPTGTCPPGDQSGVSCGWPATWGGADAQSFYQNVPRAYCRTCHVALANFLNVDSFTDWTAKAGSITQAVFASEKQPPEPNFMPLAERPYDAFWQNFDAQSAMQAFLEATGP